MTDMMSNIVILGRIIQFFHVVADSLGKSETLLTTMTDPDMRQLTSRCCQ